MVIHFKGRIGSVRQDVLSFLWFLFVSILLYLVLSLYCSLFRTGHWREENKFVSNLPKASHLKVGEMVGEPADETIEASLIHRVNPLVEKLRSLCEHLGKSIN